MQMRCFSPPRKLYAVLAQFGFVAVRKAHNKIVDLRGSCSIFYLLGRSFLFPMAIFS